MYKILLIQSVFQLKWHQHIKSCYKNLSRIHTIFWVTNYVHKTILSTHTSSWCLC